MKPAPCSLTSDRLQAVDENTASILVGARATLADDTCQDKESEDNISLADASTVVPDDMSSSDFMDV